MRSRSILLFQPPETHTCSYLPEQQARSLYADPREDLDQETLTLLSMNGFRRSGRLLYRPDCPNCNACQSVRVIVSGVNLNRTQKRILKRNRDLRISVSTPDAYCYTLFERYINSRHADGDMYPADQEQFRDFLLRDFGTTRFLLAHHQDRLIACMVFDLLLDGVSSVYCFYDPDEEQRSPGTFMILTLNAIAQALHKPYNYLGYYVMGSRKMAYKQHFRPQEVWVDGRWQARAD